MEGKPTSMAISCMWAWMIPHFYIEFTEYRLALAKARPTPSSSIHDNNARNDDSNEEDASWEAAQKAANKATVRGLAWAMGIIGTLYVGSALVIGGLTEDNSNGQVLLTKPDAIAVGVGRLLSAGLLAYFSVEFPKWLGISYASQKRVECYKRCRVVLPLDHHHPTGGATTADTATTTATATAHHQHQHNGDGHRELSFRVGWSVLGHFFTLYPLLLTYFCNESFAHVALSTAVGSFFGVGVICCVWLGHTKLHYRVRKRLAFGLSVAIATSSAIAFSAGCWYIKTVWLDHAEDATPRYVAATFGCWLAGCWLAHYIRYRLTQRKLDEAKARLRRATADMDDTVTSEVPSLQGHTQDVESIKGEWRYTSQVFQPPLSIQCVPISMPAFWKRGKAQTKPPDSQDEDVDKSDNDNIQDNDTGKEDPRSLDDTSRAGNLQRLATLGNISKDFSLEPVPQSPVSESLGKRQEAADDKVVVRDQREGPSTLSIERMDVTDHLVAAQSEDIESSTQQPTTINAIAASLVDMPNPPRRNIILLPDDSADISPRQQPPLPRDNHQRPPSLWSMIQNNSSCCRKRQHYQAPRKTKWSKLATFTKWTLWMVVSLWHISFTIISIGASYQRNRVRKALQPTFKQLYPLDYNTGAMCAWDTSSENATIRTFDSLQDVRDANYTVIHCGECGACSNWNDLSLQWTTRDHLALLAKDCSSKSIFGSRDDVQTCNEVSIGFTDECAQCWTMDEYCARDNCMFLFLQSVFTNQMNNFNVGPEDITTATCDEALCGPDFVPCSGATRRRMNIVSDIPRPISQQCSVAQEDWSLVFDNP